MKVKDADIPLSYLQECFVISPTAASGLQWRTRPREHFANLNAWVSWNTKYAGTPAGSLNNKGYWHLRLHFDGRKRRLLAHRISWTLAHGRWPLDEIDHRNGVPSENRPGNLREASNIENGHNRKKSRNNTSGFPGVHREKRKWCARIGLGGRNIYLGSFEAPEVAYAAYLTAKAELHPFQPVPRGET
jgi:hypothetical protein